MAQSSKLVTDLQKEMKIIMMVVKIIMMRMIMIINNDQVKQGCHRPAAEGDGDIMMIVIITIIIIRSSKRVTDLQRKLPGIQQKLSTIRGRDEQVLPVDLIIDLHNHYYHQNHHNHYHLSLLSLQHN